MRNLRGKDIHNGALVALDYQTGELIAYVGSANYYATKSTKQFQAKYDVVGSGFRQPGSAFKPFNYLTAIDDKKLTAGSMLMDTATDFGGKYTPSDADNLERGPVRVRTALQFSLNIPSVKTAQINTLDHVFARAKDFGMVFQTRQDERRPVDRARRPGGPAGRPRHRLRDPRQRRQEDRPHDDPVASRTRRGKDVDRAVPAARRRAGREPAGRLHRDRHPGRQHEPEDQPVLGQVRAHRARQEAPPGDAQDRHEQRRQGPQRLRLHRPADGGQGGRRASTPSRSAPGTATATTP